MYKTLEHNLRNNYKRNTNAVNKINKYIEKICNKNFYTPELGKRINHLREIRQQKIQAVVAIEAAVQQHNFDFLNPSYEVLQMKYLTHVQQVKIFKEQLQQLEIIKARREYEENRTKQYRINGIRSAIQNKIQSDINGNLSYIRQQIIRKRESRANELEKFKFKQENLRQECINNFSYHKSDLEDVVVTDVFHQPVASYKKRPLNLTAVIILILLLSGLFKIMLTFAIINGIISFMMMEKENNNSDDYKIEIIEIGKVRHEEPARNRLRNKGELTMRASVFSLNY
jgi:hypothetical protein